MQSAQKSHIDMSLSELITSAAFIPGTR
jgi:hypothetical protein